MAKKKETTVEDKLRALYDLQLIDSRVDEIRSVRGELPLEVEDLEDDVLGLKTRMDKLKTDVETVNFEITAKKNLIEESKVLIKKYAEQQKNVRNSREFNSLGKEVEFQELEISEREAHLKHKKSELDAILSETEKEEKALLKKSEEFEDKIEERLIKAYKRIRHNVKNGLAVVPIERGASGGSFFTIPPQVQVEIASRKKIITDEHSGRILVDPTLADEEQEKMQKLFKKI
jgi:predicted  nucleic acid-binding Zn-ribbon protein